MNPQSLENKLDNPANIGPVFPKKSKDWVIIMRQDSSFFAPDRLVGINPGVSGQDEAILQRIRRVQFDIAN